MQARFIYSRHYDFSLFGLERLHPFDAHKFSNAWAIVQGELGEALQALWLKPEQPISDAELLRVHTAQYLQSLRSSAVVAKALELQPAKFVPNLLLRSRLLKPMRLAVQGTVLATQCALEGNVAMNFAGGYHHAFRDHGEGFCLFADVPVAIESQRALGRLRTDDRVVVIDLDAHRGNGFESILEADPAVSILDVYNAQFLSRRSAT
jgi:histone deacetylase 11